MREFLLIILVFIAGCKTWVPGQNLDKLKPAINIEIDCCCQDKEKKDAEKRTE